MQRHFYCGKMCEFVLFGHFDCSDCHRFYFMHYEHCESELRCRAKNNFDCDNDRLHCGFDFHSQNGNLKNVSQKCERFENNNEG